MLKLAHALSTSGIIAFFSLLLAQDVLPTALIRVSDGSDNNGIIPAGTDVVLTCMTSGTTSPVTWARNDVPVESNAAFEIGSTGGLTLRDFSEMHVGNYTCVVSNIVGIVSSPTLQLQLSGQW